MDFELFLSQSHCSGECVASDPPPALEGQGEGEEIPRPGPGHVQVGPEERPQEHLGGERHRRCIGAQRLHPGGQGHFCSGELSLT